jgi:oligo-1,6-glucosidase
VQGREHFLSQEGAHKILQELRRDVLDHYDCFTVGESAMVDLRDARLLCDAERKELDMLFYFDHLEVDRRIAKYIPKKFKANKLLNIITKWQQGLEWNANYFENHDQPRIVSHYGDDSKFWERSAKLLAVMLLTLRGTPYIYQGQEIGMTNFDFTSISQLDDIETLNVDKLMRSFFIPARLRWKWIMCGSRDNARTPMQWSAEPGAGFTKGTPWLGINSNHVRINHKDQQGRDDSLLSFYKKMIALRASSDTLKYGDFAPEYSDSSVLAYSRTQLGEGLYTIILNFSGKPASTPFEGNLMGKVVVSNVGRKDYDGNLSPWEAVVLKIW